jgi:hypothetical protein
MFHEIFLAPLQRKTFRSPEVVLFSFVNGSTHAVMTPLWTPGLAVLPAPAIAVTTAKRTTTATTNSLVDGDFITSTFLPASSGGGGSSAPRISFSEAGQKVAQVARFSAINGQRRTIRIRQSNPSAAASRFVEGL